MDALVDGPASEGADEDELLLLGEPILPEDADEDETLDESIIVVGKPLRSQRRQKVKTMPETDADSGAGDEEERIDGARTSRPDKVSKSMAPSESKRLTKGEEVEFEITQGDKGPQASNVIRLNAPPSQE